MHIDKPCLRKQGEATWQQDAGIDNLGDVDRRESRKASSENPDKRPASARKRWPGAVRHARKGTYVNNENRRKGGTP